TRNANLTPGTGKPGAIAINSEIVEINSQSPDNPTGINANVNAQSGGSITINSPSQITVNGASAAIDSTTKGTGDGGNITLTTPQLNLNHGSVTASAKATGNAGAIALDVEQINSNNGQIIAESKISEGGNLQINSDSLLLDNNSLISTSVNDGNGNGGNITITNSDLVLARNNSDIRANAVEGTGGKINITSQLLFTDLSSDIDASSRFGLDGTVVIQSPKSEQQLPPGVLPEQIATLTRSLTTTACPIANENSSVYVDNGSVTQSPKSSQNNTIVRQNLPFDNKTSPSTTQFSTIISQADTLIKSASGEIELVATHPVASSLKFNCNQ
ncbi:MAG: hypothetical protein ACRC80_19575, partial [Waterburya sp.]